MFEGDNKDRNKSQICSMLPAKKPEKHQCLCSGIFFLKFEQILLTVQVYFLFTLNISLPTVCSCQVSLAKWLSVRLRTKWFWVRVQLQSLHLYPVVKQRRLNTNSVLTFQSRFSFIRSI